MHFLLLAKADGLRYDEYQQRIDKLRRLFFRQEMIKPQAEKQSVQ